MGEDLPPAVDPAKLMRRMSGRGFGARFLVSAVAHAAVIGATSVGFVKLCLEHGTLDPRATIREIEREEAAKKKEAEREAARKKLLEAKAKAEAEAKKQAEARPAAGGGDEKERPKTPVEKRVEETSDERPDEPDVRLDDALDTE